jgi:hypothetical protein
MPDVAITSTGAVAIVLATTGVPNNTKATFYITIDSNFSPSAPDIVSTATITNNAATLSVALPTGVNRIFVRAAF